MTPRRVGAILTATTCLLVLASGPALAHDCSSPSDCFTVARWLTSATSGLAVFGLFVSLGLHRTAFDAVRSRTRAWAKREAPWLNTLGNMSKPMSPEEQAAFRKAALSVGLDLLPGVGTAKGGLEGVVGRDLVTGHELEDWERALGMAPYVGKAGKVRRLTKLTGGRGTAGLGDLAEGARLSDTVLRDRFGFPAAALEHARDVARRHNVRLDVRPANPASTRWLEQGHPPKPKELPMKTIDEIDTTYLGAQPGNEGLVGLFEPRKPVRPPGMADAEWAQIEKRYKLRSDEMIDHHRQLTASKRFDVVDGVVTDAGSGRAYAGDLDVFDIRRGDGHRLSKKAKQEVLDDLANGPFGAQHGDHLSWRTATDQELKAKLDIIDAHREGGEALARITPDGDVTAAYHRRW